jgi:hypothetical protein
MSVKSETVKRVLDAINFRRPDRVPVWESLQSKAVYEHFAPGVPFPHCAVIACHKLGIDATYGCMRPPEDQAAAGREDLVVAGGTAWSTTPGFGSLEELRSWRPGKFEPRRVEEQVLESWQRMTNLYAPDTLFLSQDCGWGFMKGYDTQTWSVIALAMMRDMGPLRRYWDVKAERAAFRNSVIAKGRLMPVVQCCEDVAYKNGLMVSPEILAGEFFPRFKRVIAPLKEAGIKVIWHSDGRITEVIDQALAIGIDGINPVDPSAGMDMGALRRKYGRRLIMVGNVDGSRILPFGSEEEVRQDVRRCIRDGGMEGGLLLQCGSGQIMPDVPLGNVLAYVDEAHRYG